MIPGYDDYHERIQRGLPAYTGEGLIAKINALQDECYKAGAQVDPYRDELTELLGMEWVGNVCPGDKEIIAAVKARVEALEAALIEERARSLWMAGDDPEKPANLEWRSVLPEPVRKIWEAPARGQLQSEDLL